MRAFVTGTSNIPGAILQKTLALPLCLLLSILPPVSLGQDAGRMTEVIQYHVDNSDFMGAVLIARDGDVLLSDGYGAANLEWEQANTPATKFRIGSITKQFTAAAILLLEEGGQLSIGDRVSQHLPDAPKAWNEITLFHLLTHSAGIPNFTSMPEYQAMKLQPATVAEVIASFRDQALEFPPGEGMSYSNSGYLLLGQVIEAVSGQSYADFLQENIFSPLGMADSGYDSHEAILPRRAAGYVASPGGLINASHIDMSVPHAAGALYSTAEDLLRWTRGLFGGLLLSSESLDKMITPFKNNYALGLVIENAEESVIMHGGGIEGFNTHLAYYPEHKLTAVVLGNVNGSAPAQITAQLAALALGGEVLLPNERQALSLVPAQLRKFTGSYELAPTVNMLIRLEDGQLSAQLGGQQPVPLFAESESLFFSRIVDAQIAFEFDDAGEVIALVLHQNGAEQRAPRIPERQEITLSAEQLEQYVGGYQLAPGFELAITLEDGQLMSQATGQGKAPLFAEAEDRFFLKVANAQIEFVRNASGAVEALILHQGGRQTRAPRSAG